MGSTTKADSLCRLRGDDSEPSPGGEVYVTCRDMSWELNRGVRERGDRKRGGRGRLRKHTDIRTHTEEQTYVTHTHRGSKGVRGGEMQIHTDTQIHTYKHTYIH